MKTRLKKSLLVLMVTVQVCFYPATTFADSSPATDTAVIPSTDQSQTAAPTQTAPTTPGPTKPSGADASTYHYNETTGLWENDYFTWNPTTRQTQPKTPLTYSYNPATGRWDTTNYAYSPASNTYTPQTFSTNQPPANAITAGGPTAVQSNAVQTSPAPSDTNTGTFDLFYNNQISNTLNATAQSGDATVQQNTHGGSASTGSAVNTATILNMLQSSYGVQPGAISTFTRDITENIDRDLVLDPSQLVMNNALKLGQVATAPNIDINSSASNKITNNITLDSTSGNATVSQNNTAGDASTGDASALANVINVISSAINAGQSFIGNVNIYADLNGDILLPDSLKEKIFADDAPTTTLDSSQIQNPQVLADVTNNSSITNNTNLGAASGEATVDQNTHGGSATAGDALTNLTLLNLTGKQIIGKNSLLVFVNVMGKWVGAIMDAPTGANTAVLGDVDATASDIAGNATLNSTTSNAITNNINVQAKSGDASVDNNTHGGNATSGNAHAGLNLLNISNSSLSLSDWFGVLFINVFGSWEGSFGVDTAAGTTPDSSAPSKDSTSSSQTVTAPQVKAFAVSTTSDGSYKLTPVSTGSYPVSPNSNDTQQQNAHILGTSFKKPSKPLSPTSADMKHFAQLSIISVVLGLILLASERVMSLRQRRATQAA